MRCVEQPQLLKLMVDIAADHLTQNFLKGNEEVLKDFKVTTARCCEVAEESVLILLRFQFSGDRDADTLRGSSFRE